MFTSTRMGSAQKRAKRPPGRVRRAARVVLITFCTLSSTASQTRAQVAPSPTGNPRSPSVAALERAAATDKQSALDAFWARITRDGAPLIEPIPGDPGYSLLTFVWRGSTDVRNIVLFSGLTNNLSSFTREDLDRHQLRRLKDTDLWYHSYRVPSDARFMYYLSLNDDLTPSAEVSDWTQRTATWRDDPLNPRRHIRPHEDRDWIISDAILPAAPPLEWEQRRSGVPEGRVQEVMLPSRLLSAERRLWIYTSAVPLSPGERYSLVVMFDGWAAIHRDPTTIVLDNLINARRIPPLVAVMVDQVDRAGELGCDSAFSAFVTHEVVPFIRAGYSIHQEPQSAVVGGASRGGLAAACAGLLHPTVFGNVYAHSGQFTWKAGDSELDEDNQRTDAEYGWVMRRFAASPQLPIRFYLSVGKFERGEYGFLAANRHFRDVLVAKGYNVTYQEFSSGHGDANPHLANALITLLGPRTPRAPR